jgi:hypothetical protein
MLEGIYTSARLLFEMTLQNLSSLFSFFFDAAASGTSVAAGRFLAHLIHTVSKPSRRRVIESKAVLPEHAEREVLAHEAFGRSVGHLRIDDVGDLVGHDPTYRASQGPAIPGVVNELTFVLGRVVHRIQNHGQEQKHRAIRWTLFQDRTHRLSGEPEPLPRPIDENHVERRRSLFLPSVGRRQRRKRGDNPDLAVDANDFALGRQPVGALELPLERHGIRPEEFDGALTGGGNATAGCESDERDESRELHGFNRQAMELPGRGEWMRGNFSITKRLPGKRRRTRGLLNSKLRLRIVVSGREP